MPHNLFLEQALATYLRSPFHFLEYRLRYYADMLPISQRLREAHLFRHPLLTSLLAQQRQTALDRIAASTAEIIIVTATKNRAKSLRHAYALLASQKACPDWLWLVVDNGSQDQTLPWLSSLQDSRVLVVSYLERTGCAFPVRNFGLDVLQLGLRKNHRANQWILILDSDDRLHDSSSLHEVAALRRAWVGRRLGHALLHGFAVCEYEDKQGVSYGTHPHNIASSFPRINALVEVYDKGLNILSGMFPVEALGWLRYPEEFSFEDNGFNHKLLLRAKRNKQIWLATAYPITVKRFHQETMAAHNDQLGDQTSHAKIGEHTVTGVRAHIVSFLHDMTDYFQREHL
jgi:hypothetical protein